MADDYDQEIPDEEKIKIASDFIKNAPAGEFNEVFNDVRVLLGNDELLKEGAAQSFARYNRDQFTPVEMEGEKRKTLITEVGDLGEGRFLDPTSGKSFAFDHLTKAVSDIQEEERDATSEPFRLAMDFAAAKYLTSHFPAGNLTVYGKSSGDEVTLTVCLEDHKFNPKNFWNGRWRSSWTVKFGADGSGGSITGVMRIQVHYYEDGNVQLQSSKDVSGAVPATSDPEAIARAVVDLMETQENDYQTALNENYNVMSDTTFKALRRQLPVTHSKLDWNKILAYKLGAEMDKK
jgi:capping protein alpha